MILMAKKSKRDDDAHRVRGTRPEGREIQLAPKREYPAIQEW